VSPQLFHLQKDD